MVVLIIFPVILQTIINVIMMSIGGQGACSWPHNVGTEPTFIPVIKTPQSSTGCPNKTDI